MNFDPARFPPMIGDLLRVRDELKKSYEAACQKKSLSADTFASGAAVYQLPKGKENDVVALGAEGIAAHLSLC